MDEQLKSRAKQFLIHIAQGTLRDFYTIDCGRADKEDGVSSVVQNRRAKDVLGQIRINLPKGLIAFMGTSRWKGKKKFREKIEIVISAGADQFDILRRAETA